MPVFVNSKAVLAFAAVFLVVISSAPRVQADVGPPITASLSAPSSTSLRELRVPLEILHPNYNGPGGRYISATFLGTAHVSSDSSDEVRRIMSVEDFDVVMLELCPEVRCATSSWLVGFGANTAYHISAHRTYALDVDGDK